MSRYQCRFCSHVYDEELGDPEGGVAPGTKWEDVPDSWLCPECGAEKCDYDLIEE